MADFSGLGLRALMMEVQAVQQENLDNGTVVLTLENIYQALGFCLHTKEYCEKQIREAQADNAKYRMKVNELKTELKEVKTQRDNLLEKIEI
jgi:hypothetical protein